MVKKLESLCESNGSTKQAKSYRKIKESYRTEEYLKMCLPRYQRSLFKVSDTRDRSV